MSCGPAASRVKRRVANLSCQREGEPDFGVASGETLGGLDVPAPVWSGALSPDGKILAVAAYEGRIYFCDRASRRSWTTQKDFEDRVNCLAFSADGRMLVSGGQDRTVKLWDVATGRALATLGTHEAAVFAVAFAPDGRQVASGGFDKLVRLWPIALEPGADYSSFSFSSWAGAGAGAGLAGADVSGGR